MQRAVIHADGHSKNSMFSGDASVHRFYPNYIGLALKKSFYQHGIDLNTTDMHQGGVPAFDLVCEGQANLRLQSGRPYLLALENPYLNRLNRDQGYLKQFIKIFTWDKANFSLPFAIQIRIPWSMSYEHTISDGDRALFSCMVNSNKNFKASIKGNLYNERIQIIRFFEKNYPSKFNLYGFGWEKPPRYPGPFGHLQRQINRAWLTSQGLPAFPSYQGTVEDKLEIYRQHKFAFCYENIDGLDNYVTEKIFDALRAGCIPIYKGARNVADIVPKECFIDARNYSDLQSLYRFLDNLNRPDILKFQRSGKAFLEHAAASVLDVRLFADHVASIIVKDLEGNG